MVAVKTAELSSFLKSAGSRIDAWLIHGVDAGQVSETVRSIAQSLSATSVPPGEILRLSDQDLAQTPGRLASEARSLPMFGGRPVIIVRQGPQLTPASCEDLFDGPPLAAFIIIEAGNLKRDSKLRQLFEKAKSAAAVACYGADERSLPQLIRDDVKSAGMSITPEAVQHLASLLGADWAVSRGEIAKLTLYAAGEHEITLAHVEAIVGDASAHAFDAAIGATLAGDTAEALSQVDGLASAGTPAAVFLNVLLRHLQDVHQVLAATDRGDSFDAAAGRLRPPPHFKQKDALKAQCSRWRLIDIGAAIAATHEAVRLTRLQPVLEHEIASELIIRLANVRAMQKQGARR